MLQVFNTSSFNFGTLYSAALGYGDNVYSYLSHNKPKDTGWFRKGWGLYSEDGSELDVNLRFEKHIYDIRVNWETEWKQESGYVTRQAKFITPATRIAEHLPKEVKTGYFMMVKPSEDDHDCPMVVFFAATGDEGYFYRKTIAVLLAERGIGTLIHINPYYGKRKPPEQRGVRPMTFSDGLLMGSTTINEGRSLLKWIRADFGHRGPLGVTGFSMGGNTALIVGLLAPFPVAVVPFIPAHSGTAVFDGFLQKLIEWEALLEEKDFKTRKEAQVHIRQILEFSDCAKYLKWQKHPIACVSVSAQHDKFLSASSDPIQQVVKQCSNVYSDHRVIWGGHVSTFILHRVTLCNNVEEAFSHLTTYIPKHQMQLVNDDDWI